MPVSQKESTLPTNPLKFQGSRISQDGRYFFSHGPSGTSQVTTRSSKANFCHGQQRFLAIWFHQSLDGRLDVPWAPGLTIQLLQCVHNAICHVLPFPSIRFLFFFFLREERIIDEFLSLLLSGLGRSAFHRASRLIVVKVIHSCEMTKIGWTFFEAADVTRCRG